MPTYRFELPDGTFEDVEIDEELHEKVVYIMEQNNWSFDDYFKHAIEHMKETLV